MAELLKFPVSPQAAPPDQCEREQALDITQSWIVEAPAGSGKTGLLIQRYLKLLADEEVREPEQVLAITFTDKAAAEIRERVIFQLVQLEAARGVGDLGSPQSPFERGLRADAQAVLARDAALGWGLLERPDRLNVRTIDSVCAEIARSLPVLSGAAGALDPTPEAEPLYREAARRTLQQLGGEDASLSDALKTVLLHRDGNLGDVQRLIAEMLQWRDQWGRLFPRGRRELDDTCLEETVRPELDRTLEKIVENGLSELAGKMPAEFLHELAELASALAEMEPFKRDISPVAVCRGRGVPGSSATNLEHWRALIHLLVTAGETWRSSKGITRQYLGLEIEKYQRDQLIALKEQIEERGDVLEAMLGVRQLPPAHYPDDQWVVAKALFRVLSRALAELQLVFAERGECDFTELALLASAALKTENSEEAIETALGMRFCHLLVDEMQDTSTSQYELIELLTRGWSGGGQTLFLVGDPKQSIYLFRQARVERFVRTMQTGAIGEMPLACLRLAANFRSQSRLVDAFNEDFSLLFPAAIDAAHPESVPFAAAVAVRGPAENGAGSVVWHAEALPPGLQGDQLKAERNRRSLQEAAQIRDIVQQWRARPLPAGRTKPWTIAVLVQSRSHLSRIVAALKDSAIPFRAVDIEGLGERPEILDLFALTRALLHPADRVAWLAVLRAPWCGLGLAELHLLAGCDDYAWSQRSMEDAIAERGHELSEESCQRLVRLWKVIEAAMRQRSRLPLAQWVERAWRSLGGDAYLSATEFVNARRYFELLDSVEEESVFLDWRMLQQRLDKLYAEPETSEDAVDLMTIHKSKGLQWDVVIVPGLERAVRVNQEPLLTWSEIGADEEDAQVLLAPIPSKGGDSGELNTWLKNLLKARAAAERRRLFYVACTRAQEEVHLFAAPSSSAKGEPQPKWNSLLKAAWPVAERQFKQQPATEVRVEAPDEDIYELAAASESRPMSYPTIARLPLNFEPMKFLGAPLMPQAWVGDELARTPPMCDKAAHGWGTQRPEGSLNARALGNGVHVFLELLARQISEGASAKSLLDEIKTWDGRIMTMLRGEGLSSAEAAKLLPQVRTALENTLLDADGLWILSAHQDAASEQELTVWEDKPRSVRMDRIFRAGNEPRADGQDTLWIIDYKTTQPSSPDVEGFLQAERKLYAPQMETYARVMRVRDPQSDLRLALYFPLLPRLVWWSPGAS